MKQNKKPYVVVVTGGIATGKSAVVQIIKDLGYAVSDCDKIVHEGYEYGEKLYSDVVETFGSQILDEHKNIDRKILGSIVFSNKDLLAKLNSTVHKYVVAKLKKDVNESNDLLMFLDIPLMFEEKDNLIRQGLEYDEIWLVYTNRELQCNRLRDRAIRENKNPDEVVKIINNQIPIDEKKLMCSQNDKIIDNSGTLENLKLIIVNNIKKLLSNNNFE